MRCSHCGDCCKETEMLLSNDDIGVLEEAGYKREEFARFDKNGYVKLRNRKRFCIFYDRDEQRCRVYKIRPEGCRTYPVVCTAEGKIVTDTLCPMIKTVSKKELEGKGRKVVDLLKKIDSEAADRRKNQKLDVLF